jgi:hypothetical protein
MTVTMRLADFESLARRMEGEIPAEFLEGVVEIVVSPRVVPHPEREGIFTLGEAVPLPWSTDRPEATQTRIVLYYGSFAAVAANDPSFDWERELWETLTHELEHHVEWRARVPTLERWDDAVEENFARLDGTPFDPHFYRQGEQLEGAVYRVEDDYFMEFSGGVSSTVEFTWRGRRYRVPVPESAPAVTYLYVDGVTDPPEGDLVLVLTGTRRWWHLLGGREPFEARVRAESIDEGNAVSEGA